ncbi:MAG: translation initiation factor IF-3 [Armatimonadetes bacterium]|nr:translation initiation factor IF-3 [Armatimonadota bacterium]
MNERILRFRDVRVVAADGSQMGILQTRQALEMARDQGMDLVMVAESAQPPVVKIVDFGKYKYENEKREKENKRKSLELKGIKMSPRIAEHDMQTLLKNAKKFLEEGHKVRVVCMFRQRELAHSGIGLEKMLRFADQLQEVAVTERAPALEGRQMIMILNPKPGKPAGKKDAKNQDKQNGSEEVQDHGNGEDHSTEVGE